MKSLLLVTFLAANAMVWAEGTAAPTVDKQARKEAKMACMKEGKKGKELSACIKAALAEKSGDKK